MSHFLLSESQENSIHRVRLSLSLIATLADHIPPERQAQIDPGELSSLLWLLTDQLPTAQDMPFQSTGDQP